MTRDPLHRDYLSRRSLPTAMRLLILLPLLMLLVAARPAPARAATTYTVEDCGSLGNTGAFAFFSSDSDFEGDTTGCGNGSAGLQLAVNGETPNMSLGDRASWDFDAPTGETISGLGTIDGKYSSADGWVSGWAANGLLADDPLPPDQACTAQAQKSACSETSDGWVSVPDVDSLELTIRCDESSTASVTYCKNSAADVSADVVKAVVQLSDPSSPALSVSGSLWQAAQGSGLADGWISGINAGSSLDLDYSASNPGGICTLAAALTNSAGNVVVDGTETSQSPATDALLGEAMNVTPPFRSSLPCGAANSGAGSFAPNLASLPTGTYHLNVEAQDPAELQSGAFTYARGEALAGGYPIQIDNSVPTVTISTGTTPGVWYAAPRTVIVSSSDAGDSSGLASLDCTDQGSSHTYAISGDSASVAIELSQDGQDTVSCYATSVAGNVSSTASGTVDINPLLRTATRVAAVLTAGVRHVTAVAAAATPRVLNLRRGATARVSGELTTTAGAAVADATLVVTEKVSGRTNAVVVRDVTTNAAGGFAFQLAAGPSRALTLTYAGSSVLGTASAHAVIRVRGAAVLRVPAVLRAGGFVTVTGGVLGGYVPAGGVLIQLWYRVRGGSLGWEPFERVIRTDGAGRFRISFPVNPAARGLTYEFRALAATQSGWPFVGTPSNTVTRRVS